MSHSRSKALTYTLNNSNFSDKQCTGLAKLASCFEINQKPV